MLFVFSLFDAKTWLIKDVTKMFWKETSECLRIELVENKPGETTLKTNIS